MPTYVYKCPKCGNKKDVVCRIDDRDKQEIICDKCFKDDISLNKRIFSSMKRSMPDELSVPFNFQAYWDEHLCDDEHPNGVWCTGYNQKRKLMREMGHEYKD